MHARAIILLWHFTFGRIGITSVAQMWHVLLGKTSTKVSKPIIIAGSVSMIWWNFPMSVCRRTAVYFHSRYDGKSLIVIVCFKVSSTFLLGLIEFKFALVLNLAIYCVEIFIDFFLPRLINGFKSKNWILAMGLKEMKRNFYLEQEELFNKYLDIWSTLCHVRQFSLTKASFVFWEKRFSYWFCSFSAVLLFKKLFKSSSSPKGKRNISTCRFEHRKILFWQKFQ